MPAEVRTELAMKRGRVAVVVVVVVGLVVGEPEGREGEVAAHAMRRRRAVRRISEKRARRREMRGRFEGGVVVRAGGGGGWLRYRMRRARWKRREVAKRKAKTAQMGMSGIGAGMPGRGADRGG